MPVSFEKTQRSNAVPSRDQTRVEPFDDIPLVYRVLVSADRTQDFEKAWAP